MVLFRWDPWLLITFYLGIAVLGNPNTSQAINAIRVICIPSGVTLFSSSVLVVLL